MTQIFTIENDKVVITKLALENLEGNVSHTGNLTVSDTITVDTLNVKNLITENGNSVESGNWAATAEDELNGKGFNWTWGEGSYNFMYRSGGRLWSDADIDLAIDNTYKIDNATVLSASTLGPTITKSNLRQIGNLNNLTVLGDANLGQFAFFSSNLGRIGINTEQPNGSLSIVENDIEIVAGSFKVGSASIGTYTNHDLNIITDNIPRIVVKSNGDSIFNSNVKINGTLTVDTILSDTRIDRFSPLEFKSTRDTSIYGNGLIWSGTGSPRQLIMMANPDRLWTSESFDVGSGQSYYIDGTAVLSATTLGEQVVNSNLSSVGILNSLTVNGPTTLLGDINAVSGVAQFKNAMFNDHINELSISSSGITTKNNISITAAADEVFYADTNEISIGNKTNARRPVKVYGPLSIGVNNPDPETDLTVKGNISFASKKFITGTSAPMQGTFNTGDICWNNSPQNGNYVGWVCVAEGAPGTWLPFGAIASQ